MRKYLSAKNVARLTAPGRYSIAPNTYLQITSGGTKSWLFRYRADGRQHHLGLGSLALVSLTEAIDRGHQMRRQLKIDGVDPLQHKRAAKRQQILTGVHAKTFEECSLAFVKAHEAGWRGDGSRVQWEQSLAKYAFPKIGNLNVADIDRACVLSVLEPMWTEVPETARRVRARIEAVLDFAAARGLRSAENPARWKLIKRLLPDQRRAQTVKHFAALPYRDIGEFMQRLRAEKGFAARALEFAILTAARASEAAGAQWGELDMAEGTWAVPAERMKAHKLHRVPLSRSAVALLSSLPRLYARNDVFPATRGDGPLHHRELRKVLCRLGHGDLTVHGFRSAFRDWCEERTSYPHPVIEQSLAHTIGTAVERSYRRTDLFDQRRRLMQEWAEYCNTPITAMGAVIPLRQGALT